MPAGSSFAARLHFDCTPAGELFELPVHARHVRFDENVFHEFADARIRRVWSIIDKAAIRDRLRAHRAPPGRSRDTP